MTMGNEVMLERARDFDAAALSEIYNQYQSRIYAYIYHRTGNSDLAEDLTAQVFLRVLEAIRQEKAWRSSFSGWLYRIAHNLVIDDYRHRRRMVSIDDAPVLHAHEGDPVRSAERELAVERLRKAINLLTEEQAQVISLRFLESLSIAEVVASMDKTEGAIKALQYRAVVSLRRYMEYEEA